MTRAVLKNTKLRGEARQHAERHFLAAALDQVDGDAPRLLAIYRDAAADCVPDPFHVWQRIRLMARNAAVAHAPDERAAQSLRHAIFELVE